MSLNLYIFLHDHNMTTICFLTLQSTDDGYEVCTDSSGDAFPSSSSSSTTTFSSSLLQSQSTYRFTLEVSKASRSSSAEVLLQTSTVETIDVSINVTELVDSFNKIRLTRIHLINHIRRLICSKPIKVFLQISVLKAIDFRYISILQK